MARVEGCSERKNPRRSSVPHTHVRPLRCGLTSGAPSSERPPNRASPYTPSSRTRVVLFLHVVLVLQLAARGPATPEFSSHTPISLSNSRSSSCGASMPPPTGGFASPATGTGINAFLSPHNSCFSRRSVTLHRPRRMWHASFWSGDEWRSLTSFAAKERGETGCARK